MLVVSQIGRHQSGRKRGGRFCSSMGGVLAALMIDDDRSNPPSMCILILLCERETQFGLDACRSSWVVATRPSNTVHTNGPLYIHGHSWSDGTARRVLYLPFSQLGDERSPAFFLPPDWLAATDLNPAFRFFDFFFFLIQYTFLSHLYIYIFILICINNGCSPSGVVWVFNILD